MKVSCEVISDIIPLVKDGVASEDSTQLVKEHIQSCEDCNDVYEHLNPQEIPQPSLNDRRIISAIKRRIFLTQAILLFAGAVFGIALTDSMGMFYNLTIMPVIGAVAYLVFKRRWYLTPIAIFILSYLWQTVMWMESEGFKLTSFYYGLAYSFIYAGLVMLGIMIASLLKFSFKKGETGNEK